MECIAYFQKMLEICNYLSNNYCHGLTLCVEKIFFILFFWVNFILAVTSLHIKTLNVFKFEILQIGSCDVDSSDKLG